MIAAQILFIGTTELMVVAGIALLLFGGKKVPELMRGMGKGVKEFKEGMHEVSEPIEEVKEVINDAKNLTPDSTETIADVSEKIE